MQRDGHDPTLADHSRRTPLAVTAQACLEAIPDPSVVVDEKLRILLLNHLAEDAFSLPREALAGQDLPELVPWVQDIGLEAVVQQVARERGQITIEAPAPGPHGGVWEVRVNHHDAGAMLVMRDMTETRRMQDDYTRVTGRLRHSLREYRALAAFGAEIETIHNVSELIERGVWHLLQHLKMDLAVFFQVDEGRDRWETLGMWGLMPDALRALLKQPRAAGTGLPGELRRRGDYVYFNHYGDWEGAHPEYAGAGLGTVLGMPVVLNGEVRHVVFVATVHRQVTLAAERIAVGMNFVHRLENALERVAHLEEIKLTREQAFRALGVALEHRDLETRGHTDRVVDLSVRFGQRLDLPPAQLEALRWGAYLHDMGKLSVPDGILTKPGALTEDERHEVQKHAEVGYQMLKRMRFLPTDTLDVVRHHHERWDGSGYPDGLAGESIPYPARIFALVDVYDALRSPRPYKDAWSAHAAIAHLREQAGELYDPALTAAFIGLLRGNTA